MHFTDKNITADILIFMYFIKLNLFLESFCSKCYFQNLVRMLKIRNIPLVGRTGNSPHVANLWGWSPGTYSVYSSCGPHRELSTRCQPVGTIPWYVQCLGVPHT
jgi:hypothetical protein